MRKVIAVILVVCVFAGLGALYFSTVQLDAGQTQAEVYIAQAKADVAQAEAVEAQARAQEALANATIAQADAQKEMTIAMAQTQGVQAATQIIGLVSIATVSLIMVGAILYGGFRMITIHTTPPLFVTKQPEYYMADPKHIIMHKEKRNEYVSQYTD